MRRPAWTRDTRIERLNRMVMSRLPHWTAEDVARHRAEGERMAARVAELSQPSDPLSHIHDFPCFAGQCPVDHQPSESAGAPRSDECCMDCYGPCQAAKPQPSERLRCGEPHPHYSSMSCGREPGHDDAHSYGVPSTQPKDGES